MHDTGAVHKACRVAGSEQPKPTAGTHHPSMPPNTERSHPVQGRVLPSTRAQSPSAGERARLSCKNKGDKYICNEHGAAPCANKLPK